MYRGAAFIFFAACAVIFYASCKEKPASQPGHTPKAAAPQRKNDPRSDGSYERFMDSMLARSSILYDDTAIDAGEVWLWSDEEGSYRKEPRRFHFGDTEFSMLPGSMKVINEKGNRLYSIRYETDTAFIFRFKGRKYGWAETHYYMCNGMWCLEMYYLLGDFQNKRLYVFRTMAVPDYHCYFGDLDGDERLDLLIPDYIYTPHSQLPYSDTTEFLSLTAWTLTEGGVIRPLKRAGKDWQLTGRFDSGNFAPANFRLLSNAAQIPE